MPHPERRPRKRGAESTGPNLNQCVPPNQLSSMAMELDLALRSCRPLSRSALRRSFYRRSTRVFIAGRSARPVADVRKIRYYPTAAAAQRRASAVLRCRPNVSRTPGRPEIERRLAGLRLITDGALDRDARALAVALGQRAFATPVPATWAPRRRVALTGSFTLPITDRGLTCRSRRSRCHPASQPRRFNCDIRRVYSRTPTHLRSCAVTGRSISRGYQFRLATVPLDCPRHWLPRSRAPPGVGAARRPLSPHHCDRRH